MDSITIQAKESCTVRGDDFWLDSLYAYLEKVADPHKPKGIRYHLATILLLSLLAKLGGEDHPTGIDEWAKHREAGLVELLQLPRKWVPYHCTYRRVLQTVEPDTFEQVMGRINAAASRARRKW